MTMVIALFLILQQCANPVSPSGGPRDLDPPVLVQSVPPLYTTNFDANQIRLTFDEFIELKGISQQLLISPPMEAPPAFRIRGKTLLIDLSEPLKENVTYTFYFGDAIVDMTENNPLQGFQYVLATGDILDSLSLEGSIVHASDNKPADRINIMLYLDNNDTIPLDSLPYLVKPYFMTRSGKEGKFRLNNLPDQSFLLFALEDVNASLTYDQPNERIAFHDSLVRPYFIPRALIGLSGLDTTDQPEPLVPDIRPDPVEMFLFQEKDTVQKFIRASIVREKKLMVVFKLPSSTVGINALGVDDINNWSVRESNKPGDTITLWLKNIPADTVFFEITDAGLVLDTVRVVMQQETVSRKRRTDDFIADTINPLQMTFPRGAPELNQSYSVTFEYPVIQYDPAKILLIELEDTLQANFTFEDDVRRRAFISYTWKESTAYQIIIPDSSFHDLSGRSNDSIIRHFVTKSLADYGHLFMNITLKNPGKNHIIQLLQKDAVVREVQVKGDGRIGFEYLNPGGYHLKVIYDDNGNGVWDTGKYSTGLQPERVAYFPDEVMIRVNWDVIEDWEL
jgi:hypothetical protein